MRIVVFFAVNFCDWPLKVLKIMADQDPSLEVIGLAVDTSIYNKISKCTDVPFSEVHNLDHLEKEWIDGNVSDEDFVSLENKLGSDVISKTVIADKNLASGWVDGAILYDTPLTAKARDQRNLKSYVYGFYDFLLNLYERTNPDLAFIYTIASGATYAIGAAALHHGFPFLRFQHSRIQKYFVLDTTLDGLLDPVKTALKKAEEDNNYLLEYSEPAKEYIASRRESSIDTSNLALNKKMYSKAMQWPSMIYQTIGVLKRAVIKFLRPETVALRERPERLNFIFKVYSAFVRRYLNTKKYSQPFKGYKDKKYIYFALHVDPEASTLICAPYHANQTAVIEALSKSIPLSTTLLVKEHPIMVGKRPKGFYKKIAEMPNVALIDYDEDSRQIIQNSSLVATITGTVGWEAMTLQKPLLLMGVTPYMEVGEGFVFCQDYAKLGEAVVEALDAAPASDEALTEYVAAVMKSGMHIPDELLWNQSPEVFERNEQVTKNLANYLLSYVQK